MSGDTLVLIYLSILYTIAIAFIAYALVFAAKKINELLKEMRKMNSLSNVDEKSDTEAK